MIYHWPGRYILPGLEIRWSIPGASSDNHPSTRHIFSHLESCTPGTRQYKLVRTGTCQYILFWIQGGTRKVKTVQTGTYRLVLTYHTGISMTVHTGMYWYILPGTRRYKEIQQSTRRYMVVQGTVQGGTRQYVLVCTGMY